MKPQAFQAGEVRDEHDNIIRAGAYGKKSPFTNANNTGILDYIINNFDVVKGLLDAIEAEKLKGIATQAEAEAGATSDKVMTPLRTKQAAEKFCLSKNGGEMNGSITIAPNKCICGKPNDAVRLFAGGNNDKLGATLQLFAHNHPSYAGSFYLRSTKHVNDNVTAIYDLVGESDGSLKWNEREIERVEAQGANYIRYANSLQICWGEFANATTGTVKAINLPAPYASVWNYAGFATATGWGITCHDSGSTATTFSFMPSYGQDGVKCVGRWFTIGLWK